MIAATKYLRNPWVLLALAVVVIWVLYKFRGPLFNFNVPQDLPDEPNLSATERQVVRELSMRLHRDMSGVGIGFLRDHNAWQQLMSMSDRLFVAVSNDFNRLYFKQGKGTMRKWVQDEWTWADVAGIAGRTQVLDRMASLNIN